MRETKVGVAVNKFRSHDSAEINGLVKNDQKLERCRASRKEQQKKLAIAAEQEQEHLQAQQFRHHHRVLEVQHQNHQSQPHHRLPVKVQEIQN